jgi:hypothetical protein
MGVFRLTHGVVFVKMLEPIKKRSVSGALFYFMVELSGIEPLTSTMPS